MNKLENILFGELTKQAGFYIKDYYSETLKENKWIAIMENEDFIYATVVCKNNESDFVYYEAMSFLKKTYAKKISLNIVICTGDNYESLIHQPYNKLIYSEKEKQVVYSDNSCKPLVSILNNSKQKEIKKKLKYKDNLITYILIAINVLIYLLTAIISRNIYDIDSYTLLVFGAKVNELINNGQPWRLITCAFLHGGLAHIAFNMYALKIIGSEVEYAYGKVKYIGIYLISAIGASLFSYIFNSDSISVGASGAIFGLFGAMLMFGIENRDRIGKEYVEIDARKIVGVVECNIPEEARAFKPLDPVTEQMGHNVADFLVSDLKKGHIPPQFLPLQSGVGVTSNAVLEALGQNPNVPVFSVYTEVVQDAVVKYMREGRIKDASCSSLTVTNDTLKEVYDDIDYFKQHLTIRQSEISNSPEVIRRLGVIAMNTAIECDIYGNENSSHICGSKLMNGIGGSCDYERNGFISIFTTQSTTKNGCISAIVPMCSHVDSTEHDVDVIVTEQGVADLRGKGPLRRAKEIIENCAHPDYRPMLREYLKLAEKGHEPQSMRAALAMHDTFLKKGDMRLTDFGEYLK